MRNWIRALFEWATLTRPWFAWLLLVALLGGAACFAPDFRLDASAESLVLQNDADLAYYREIRERYGSDDFLIVTYTPRGELFSDSVLDRLGALREDLAGMARVASVNSILDVPLIASPPMDFGELQREGIRTLQDPGTDRELARQELVDSPLYSELLISKDAETTALLVQFERDERYHRLLERRNELRERVEQGDAAAAEEAELERVSERFDAYSERAQTRQQQDIQAVRDILARYRADARIHLGGVPMIAADMISFIRSDLRIFGIGVAVLLTVLLAVAFRRLRWVLMPAAVCGAAALAMVGFLGFTGWRVTVVSSNFISLVLILTLSLIVHLIVRHQELQAGHPDARQRWLLSETVRSKFAPSIFTALTTMVSFGSLVVSEIRPVIDFGYMMVFGVGMAFVLTFLIFPAGLARLPAGSSSLGPRDPTAAVTGACARLVSRHRLATGLAFAVLVVAAGAGMTRLGVENRFIDYFKESTEIHQGMRLIDRKLGGTTPLDVILDAPPGFAADESDDGADDGGLSAGSFWFNSFQLEELDAIHDYLDSLPETGQVLSVATAMELLTQLNNGRPIDNFSLAIIYDRLPQEIKETLFDPYMGEGGNQMRIGIRVIDSAPNLERDELLAQIRDKLTGDFGLQPSQVHLTGMLVLYNNVLQSLFRSQILTLGVVFLAIGAMLLVLFRSLKMAVVGTIPTLVAAGSILGLMGWLGIPLDIMTITIAVITIGIGVDDTIHYAHRLREELAGESDYWVAIRRAHDSVGRALFYTSVTIALGFSILVLSNFVPTIYFGVLTGLAMILALVANLTLLPLLMARFRVFA